MKIPCFLLATNKIGGLLQCRRIAVAVFAPAPFPVLCQCQTCFLRYDALAAPEDHHPVLVPVWLRMRPVRREYETLKYLITKLLGLLLLLHWLHHGFPNKPCDCRGCSSNAFSSSSKFNFCILHDGSTL